MTDVITSGVDPAENHLDAAVEDQALARTLAMVEALKAKIARIPETLGIDPIVVAWGDPAPRSGEAWKAEEERIMSTTKASERAVRTLTDREVSDLRAVHTAGSSRQLLNLVERIIRDRAEADR